MQNPSGTHLKAANTKVNKDKTKSGSVGVNISQRGLGRLRAPQSGTKTSQSQMESQYVFYQGKVRTPKRLITSKYKQFADKFMEHIQQKQNEDKKNREEIQAKIKSSIQSQSRSQIKNMSSNHPERSEFVSSSRQEADSQSQSTKKQQTNQKKDSKALTLQDLQANVLIDLEQTQTIITFYLPSKCYNQENENIKKRNQEYQQYCKRRIGSDNYIARPAQTFNLQHKKHEQTVEKKPTIDAGAFASYWEILDTQKQQQKKEFDILQEDIKKNVDNQLNVYITNPFATLSLQRQFIDIHSNFLCPGAAEFYKQKEKNTKKKGGLGIGTGSGLVQISGNISKQQDSKSENRKDNSQKKQQSQNSNSRKDIRSTQLQLQMKQQQQKIEQQELGLLNQTMQQAKKLPSELQRKLMVNQNLQINLKYIDRILNSQTYHREYILYRNYPEIQFVKKIPEDQVRNFKRKKQEKKQEVNKEPLQYLFSFKCKITNGYSVTSADWNPVNKDLLAVSYELIQKDSDSNEREEVKKSYLMFWTLKNPAFPEKIIESQSRITACKFSKENPNLIACGTFDGVVIIYDIRKKDGKPIAQNKQSLDKHTNAVWDIQWISKSKGSNKGESLVSISADGRITEWSMKKGLQFTDLMLLKRIPQSNKRDTVQNMNFRSASGLSFQFLKNQNSMYLATTEQGVIYRCSKSYTQQYLEVYLGHNGPVYKVRSNQFLPDIFLTCSADWSCKLWNWRRDQPLQSFQSLDLNDEVIDIEWSPTQSVLFASVCKDGRLQLWDLSKKNMLDPIAIMKTHKSKKGEEQIAKEDKLPSKTLVRFCKGAPVLITGDVQGDINVYRLNRDQQNLDPAYQTEKITKLLYPNGYKMGSLPEQSVQIANQQQVKNTQTEQQ